MLGFSCVGPIKTVHGLLEAHGALGLLRDPLITTTTQEIIAEKRTSREIERDIREKERAIETLSAKYCLEPRLPQETVRQALYSIGDNHAFLRTNRDPCDRVIGYLQKYFHPTQVRDKNGADSLAIRSGRGGSRLSHDHARQYVYVVQSLALWREILHGTLLLFHPSRATLTHSLRSSDMFHLWSLAEQDLLSETISYRLRDTGQGLNRVQAAPKTSRMMHAILNRAQKSLGGWVGSSVIYMGDHNVPNALMFIGMIHPPFSYSPVSKICPLKPTCVPHACRQILTDLPHPPAHLQHTLPAADAVHLARAVRVRGCGVWLPRRALHRHPQRLFPTRVRRERRGQFL